jgi:hypothetical protein
VNSLDDLLDVGEPAEPEQPDRQRTLGRGWSWLLWSLVRSAVGTIVIYALARAAVDRAISIPFLFVGLLAVHVLVAVLIWVRSPVLPDTLRMGLQSADRGGAAGRDGLAQATQRWSRQLAWFGLQTGDGEQFARTLQPRLARLAEERLRLRHGITRESDPQRARQLLGEPLWALITVPARRSPTGRELAALVKHMEAI